MKKSIFGTTILTAAGLALGGGGLAWAQAAPQGEAPAVSASPAPDSSHQPVSDTWITAKVKTELAITEGVRSGDVSVTTTDGVVTLTGVLDSDVAVKKAEAAAQSVKGVRSVDSTGLKARS